MIYILVETLNDAVVKEKTKQQYVHNINQIVSEVTFKLLNNNPRIIADVENGNVKKRLLKTEIIKILDEIHHRLNRNEIIKETFNYIFGYGILQPYIEDESISDIDGSRYDYFTCIKNGKREKLEMTFPSEKVFEQFCKLIVIRNGGIINENDSHARVSDENYKLRINVSICPRNTMGTSLSIRKHKTKAYSLEDLLNLKMYDQKIYGFLKGLNNNFLISGKGGVGKTTLLRALLNNYTDKRILICEKDSELYPEGKNFIIQKVKKKKFRGDQLTLRDLIKDGLTMSLDGYCVGEIIGSEAIDFIKGGYSGHSILGTIHSLGAEDTLYRLLSLLYESNETINKEVYMRMIGKTINYIIYLEDFRITQIIKVNGAKNDQFLIEDLFKFHDHEWRYYG